MRQSLSLPMPAFSNLVQLLLFILSLSQLCPRLPWEVHCQAQQVVSQRGPTNSAIRPPYYRSRNRTSFQASFLPSFFKLKFSLFLSMDYWMYYGASFIIANREFKKVKFCNSCPTHICQQLSKYLSGWKTTAAVRNSMARQHQLLQSSSSPSSTTLIFCLLPFGTKIFSI